MESFLSVKEAPVHVFEGSFAAVGSGSNPAMRLVSLLFFSLWHLVPSPHTFSQEENVFVYYLLRLHDYNHVFSFVISWKFSLTSLVQVQNAASSWKALFLVTHTSDECWTETDPQKNITLPTLLPWG